jgi:hypothetical protein
MANSEGMVLFDPERVGISKRSTSESNSQLPGETTTQQKAITTVRFRTRRKPAE